MAAQTTNLYLLEDLNNANKIKPLAKSDLDALRKVADWINSFVTKPHKELGRDPGVSLRAWRTGGAQNSLDRS